MHPFFTDDTFWGYLSRHLLFKRFWCIRVYFMKWSECSSNSITWLFKSNTCIPAINVSSLGDTVAAEIQNILKSKTKLNWNTSISYHLSCIWTLSSWEIQLFILVLDIEIVTHTQKKIPVKTNTFAPMIRLSGSFPVSCNFIDGFDNHKLWYENLEKKKLAETYWNQRRRSLGYYKHRHPSLKGKKQRQRCLGYSKLRRRSMG